MKALVAKEIRLLLPASGAALLLAVVPIWLVSQTYNSNPQSSVALYSVCLGTLLLAMSTFGREFGLKTFSLMLAQPLERRQIWRVKIAALAAALATELAVWSFCCVIWLHDWNGRPAWSSVVPLGVTVSVAIFAGGLWTTLLLRQVAAAFWLTALIPAGIGVLIAPDSRFGALFYVLLGLYSIGGIVLAWWQFFHAEEVGWTGGTVTLTGWRSGALEQAEQSAARLRRPLAALLRKELQLNRGGLMGIGAFFVLHLCAVMLRDTSPPTETSAVQEALEFVGGLWLLVPLFLVGPGVAEERRLGTLDVQLCQPVSSRLQFVVKLMFSLIVGGLLSAFLMWTAEGIGSARGVPRGLGEIPLFTGLKIPFDGASLLNLTEIFLGLSLAGFLASTMARGTFQAMAAAPAVVFVMLLGNTLLHGSWQVRLTGTLLPAVLWPCVTVALLWCAWRNFRFAATGLRFWRRNLLAFAGALVFGVALTGAIHNRLWEFLTPLEGAHGPARLPVAGVLDLKPHWFEHQALTLVLPDGRAWEDVFIYQNYYDPERLLTVTSPGKWIDGRGNRFINGSNWVDVVNAGRDIVGIRADGTLWVSDSPVTPRNWRDEPAKLSQFGEESDWKSVTYGVASQVVLVKKDGTLWQWTGPGRPRGAQEKVWPGLRTTAPGRLGTDSDWSRVLNNSGWLYAWKTDGTAWLLYESNTKVPERAVAIATNIVLERVPVFDNFKLRSLTRLWSSVAGVRDDGTLWIWDFMRPQLPSSPGSSFATPRQVGTETNWRMLAGRSATLTALKADGSLWQFYFKRTQYDPASLGWRYVMESRARLGSNQDWVAIDDAYGPYGDGLRALAADGSLWFWEDRNQYNGMYYGPTALAPSRKPMLIANIFTENQ